MLAFVERIGMMKHVPAFEGRADWSAQYPILVGFGHGLKARVKIRRNFAGIEHTHIARQQAIHGAHQIIRGDGIRQIEGGHLSQRVNARVGAAGPVNA